MKIDYKKKYDDKNDPAHIYRTLQYFKKIENTNTLAELSRCRANLQWERFHNKMFQNRFMTALKGLKNG